MRKNKALFLFFILFYFCTCVLDLLLTYYATPNLRLEGNPLVLLLEFGWFDLILINFVTFFFYFLMCRYAFLRYRPVLSSETESLRRYLADITYGDPEKANMGMWKWPKNWAPQIACLCWSVAVALPFARLFVVLEWALIIAKIPATSFFRFVAFFPYGRVDFFLAVLLAWGVSFVWIALSFRQNKSEYLRLRNNR